MGNNSNPSYVFSKGNTYCFNRHVPLDVRAYYTSDRVILCLKTTDNILVSGSIISGWFARMQSSVCRLAYFLRTLQTNFNPLGVSIVTAGRSGLAGRQGIATHV